MIYYSLGSPSTVTQYYATANYWTMAHNPEFSCRPGPFGTLGPGLLAAVSTTPLQQLVHTHLPGAHGASRDIVSCSEILLSLQKAVTQYF